MRGEAGARVGSGRTLVGILASPPATTSGDRTRRRLALAANVLGFDRVDVVNLFGSATATVVEISDLGVDVAPWREARLEITGGLHEADGVLLGWGCTEPAGRARWHHRAQVAWLRTTLADRGMIGWTVGGTPRHPSRWQRFTARQFPGLAFGDALGRALQPERQSPGRPQLAS